MTRADYPDAAGIFKGRLDDKRGHRRCLEVLCLVAWSFRRAIEDKDVVVSGDRRELWALRRTGWIAPEDLAEINKSMERLGNKVLKPRGPGELYGITILLTPLNRRRGKSG